MIKNWDYQRLRMDFSSMYKGDNHPSDIDLFYIARDKTLLIGEIKNERGLLQQGQRRLLETLAKGWRGDAVIMFITHNEYIQYGAKYVNVGDCLVSEMYVKAEGRWRLPKHTTRVKEILDYYIEKGG